MVDQRTFHFRVVRETDLSVTLDADKFTPEFIAEFNSYMFDVPNVEEHARNLALQFENYEEQFLPPNAFVEGYGSPNDMGIEVRVISEDVEAERVD